MPDSSSSSSDEQLWRDRPLPFLTSGTGIGGVLKQSPEDFFVEEIPAYDCSNEGEFLFLWIEKRGVSTPDVVRHIARVLSLRDNDISVAGRKDAQAVTRQYVSVPARVSDEIARIDANGIKVLRATRHGNRLKTGHLKGNRFRIVVREVCEDALPIAENAVEQIRRLGFPNYYGEQRFGADGSTDEIGFRLLAGERTRWLNPGELRFALSAVQSRLFNAWTANRLADGLSLKVMEGDVMQVAASRGPFVVIDREVEQARYESHETVLTGPIFGPKMKQPQGVPAEREHYVLEQSGLDADSFRRFKRLTSGTRRPIVVWPDDLEVNQLEDALEFSFSLPAGTYATSLMREIQKLA